MHKYGIEVVDVRHEYVMHGFEGVDGERAREAGVHCACVEVSKGGETKHVMGGGDFFILLETVNIAPGLDDGWLHGACGLNALLVAPHVALVSCCGIRQVGVDKMLCEAGNGHKFPALFEGLYKCSRRRRAQGLVYVLCIFTS